MDVSYYFIDLFLNYDNERLSDFLRPQSKAGRRRLQAGI